MKILDLSAGNRAIFKYIKNFFKRMITCDHCGYKGVMSIWLTGFDSWEMKDGSLKWLCRDCSGYKTDDEGNLLVRREKK